ncbi:MAG: hypothetical protein IJ736_08085 [Firmicutes bacterium]|nr:hypothetical protein [Bacillota bacterium]MBR1736958.1 hypothetical protein [Bacillota bacterium]
MKIVYKFDDGNKSIVEVSENIGNMILDSRRLEDNLDRKERYHCYSLDAVIYEGRDYMSKETPESIYADNIASKKLENALNSLTENQKRRIIMLADGMTISEISRCEGKDISTIRESIEAARKNLKKFLKNTP